MIDLNWYDQPETFEQFYCRRTGHHVYPALMHDPNMSPEQVVRHIADALAAWANLLQGQVHATLKQIETTAPHQPSRQEWSPDWLPKEETDSEPEVIWETANTGTSRFSQTELLAQGWEPFAVYKDIVHFRRRVK